ncbi:hypothetical protein LIER_27507 [Lithospermum erythrorhizon]|uniref:Peptidase A1 domain-containing protein n=1 Tax=Lithospermum erythrorhizon TaxID=34254 RepID=A0AAV3RFY4_LITER
MASSAQYSLLHFTFLIFFISILQLISPTFSTSRHALDHHKSKTGFRVTLTHVDAAKNLTKFERLQRAIVRGRHRLQKLSLMSLAAAAPGAQNSSEIDSPIHSGNGEFLMQLSIGTPPKSYSAIMDTGSDLVWTQCKPCINCYNQSTPVFEPKKSKSFSKLPCSNNFCRSIPTSSCRNETCEYLYTYGDESSTQGLLATDTFTFGNISVKKVAFGCGLDNEGNGFNQGAGLVGLGRGSLSLVSQLDEPKFSYCLTSIDDSKTSTLMMGSSASINISKNEITTTPLIKNPLQPTFYYLSLEGITIGATRIPIRPSTFGVQKDGTGGLIIDSGTTITYLEEDVFDLVSKAFVSQVKLPVYDSPETGLDLCFKLPSHAQKLKVPKMIFNFKGADLNLPGENYIVADSGMGVACLAMGSSSGISILGNFQQQNLLVLHDLQKETISFVPKECYKL